MSRHDPASLDHQYDSRLRVADSDQILQRWARASARSRDGMSRRLDVRYGALPAQTLDVFPAARERAPVFVFIHGGCWRALDKSDYAFIAPSLVDAGAMVVLLNHSLCSGAAAQRVGVDTVVLQLVQALAWVYRNAALYGGDAARIVVAGHDSGGHLAAMMLSCLWKSVAPDLPAQLVSAALTVSGLFDLEALRSAPFLQADVPLTAADVRRLSPVFFPAPKGRLYAVAGGAESDEFLRQNLSIRQAWGRVAVPVCETIVQAHHYSVLHDLADPQGRLHELALNLLGLG